MSDLINRQDVMQIFNTAFRGDIPYAIMGGLIKGLPSIESLSSEPSGDLISRQDAINECYRQAKEQHNILYPEDVDDILSFLPSADRPKGEWINREDSADVFFLYKYECSVCGGKNIFNSSYCPNCGAHMR